MRSLRTALPALLLTAPAATPAEPAIAAETPLAVVDGTIRSVDLDAHQLVVDVNGTATTLRLDRNTLVYAPGGLTSVAALRPGESVRAGRNGSDAAYWIEVRAAGERAAAKPGQGTGPGGAAPPPAEAPAQAPTSPSAGTPTR